MQMNDKPILICYDGSSGAARAIETAAALLGPRRAVVLDVASSMTVAESVAAPYSAMAGAAVEETYAAEAARIAAEGTEIARSSGFDAVARATRAVPTWEGIVEIADELDAPVIVIGSRGLFGPERSGPWERFAPGRRTRRTARADRSTARQARRRWRWRWTVGLGHRALSRSVWC